MMSTRAFAVLGACLVLALAVFGVQLNRAVRKGREFDRYLTVRGLSEREVKADLAIWPIRFSVHAEELGALKKAMERDRDTVLAFLAAAGIDPKEVALGLPTLSDRLDEKIQGGKPELLRYKGTTTLVVRSADVDRVKAAIQKVDVLLEKGVSLANNEYSDRPEFLFTAVAAAKPDMIREATANARAAAEKFAQDSHTRVGGIRRASQGLMEINDRDAASPEQKSLRIVTTIDFFME